ncbi:hypothetical protein IJX73_01240 [bacterium]|nr:hypothetical protein [bacterium]
MRIFPINYSSLKQSFKSTQRTTYVTKDKRVVVSSVYDNMVLLANSKSSGVGVKVSNYTSFLRGDLHWNGIGEKLKQEFPKGKVNVYDFACSDGSEAYSLIIALKEQLGDEEAQRFFPIHASDVDSQIIKMAKSGKIHANRNDIVKLTRLIKDRNIEKYFDYEIINSSDCVLYPKECLSDNVTFQCEDIETGLSQVKKSNSLIMCRNFWKYLSPRKMAQVSMALRNAIDDSSRVVIGNFDKDFSSIPFFMKELGMKQIGPSRDEANILKIDEARNPYRYLDNQKAWQNRVDIMYREYVPSMDDE